jgi:hypothetical protein
MKEFYQLIQDNPWTTFFLFIMIISIIRNIKETE